MISNDSFLKTGREAAVSKGNSMEIPSVPRMGNDGNLAGGPFVEPPDGAEELGNMARRRVVIHWTLAKPIDFYKALQNYVYYIYIYMIYIYIF